MNKFIEHMKEPFFTVNISFDGEDGNDSVMTNGALYLFIFVMFYADDIYQLILDFAA